MENKLNITVNDFSKICRLCLKRDRKLKPIFKSESMDLADCQTESLPLSQMITACFGFNVSLLFCKQILIFKAIFVD